MTDTNTAAQNDTNARQNGPKWPQRFGTVKRVQIKNGKKGRYAILTVDCKKFEQVAFAFSAKIVSEIEAAGVGANVWFKGPMEPVKAANGVETDQMKIVYFKNKTAEAAKSEDDAPEAAGDDAGETGAGDAGETGQADGQTGEMSDEKVDDEIPF